MIELIENVGEEVHLIVYSLLIVRFIKEGLPLHIHIESIECKEHCTLRTINLLTKPH